jgi:glycosyltransferase EpsE
MGEDTGMSREPLVSVLMGAYNCAATVGASIESILSQDYANLEFVVCDDGSKDTTADVLSSYASRDPRIVLLRNVENLGLSRTLNRCLETARGEYLARMDGDDFSKPDRIGKQVRFLETHSEYALCGSSIELFDASGTWGKLDYPEVPVARSFLLRSPYAHPTVMFRAAALRAAGGYDSSPEIGRSEDYDLFMRLHEAGSRGYNLQEYLLSYREELGSFKRRKFRYALTEARVRWRGFHRLGLLPLGLPFVVKPILVGLIPRTAYTRIRKAISK